jgi:hypothetical protein
MPDSHGSSGVLLKQFPQQPCGVSDQPVPKVWLAGVEHAQVLRIDLVAAGGFTPQRFYERPDIWMQPESSHRPQDLFAQGLGPYMEIPADTFLYGESTIERFINILGNNHK